MKRLLYTYIYLLPVYTLSTSMVASDLLSIIDQIIWLEIGHTNAIFTNLTF